MPGAETIFNDTGRIRCEDRPSWTPLLIFIPASLRSYFNPRTNLRSRFIPPHPRAHPPTSKSRGWRLWPPFPPRSNFIHHPLVPCRPSSHALPLRNPRDSEGGGHPSPTHFTRTLQMYTTPWTALGFIGWSGQTIRADAFSLVILPASFMVTVQCFLGRFILSPIIISIEVITTTSRLFRAHLEPPISTFKRLSNVQRDPFSHGNETQICRYKKKFSVWEWLRCILSGIHNWGSNQVLNFDFAMSILRIGLSVSLVDIKMW